jgi:hypothetical protein
MWTMMMRVTRPVSSVHCEGLVAEYDFAKLGKPLVGYTSDTHLGLPHLIRPAAMDEFATRVGNLNLAWDYVPFAKINQDQIPAKPGIYLFIVHPRTANIERHSIILYFGRAKNLRTRFRDYVEERLGARPEDRQAVVDMLNIYRNRIEFGFAVMDYYRTEEIEDLLIYTLTPCCNTRRSKPMAPTAAFE